jgi:hypothetical protein
MSPRLLMHFVVVPFVNTHTQCNRYNWAYIAAPFKQSIEFKFLSGVDHMVFYIIEDTDESFADGLPLIGPYLREGMATVMMMPREFSLKNEDKMRPLAWLSQTDCLWRTKVARIGWVQMQHDIDEYLLEFPVTNVVDFQLGMPELLLKTHKEDKAGAVYLPHRYVKPPKGMLMAQGIGGRGHDEIGSDLEQFKHKNRHITQSIFAPTLASEYGFPTGLGKVILRPDKVFTSHCHSPTNMAVGYSEILYTKYQNPKHQNRQWKIYHVTMKGWEKNQIEFSPKNHQKLGLKPKNRSVPIEFGWLTDVVDNMVYCRSLQTAGLIVPRLRIDV